MSPMRLTTRRNEPPLKRIGGASAYRGKIWSTDDHRSTERVICRRDTRRSRDTMMIVVGGLLELRGEERYGYDGVHGELAIGTLLSIIRQSGIPRAQFEE